MTEETHEMEKKLEYLEGLSREELTIWMKRYLAENRTYPLSISHRDTYRSSILLQFYFISADSEFRRRFEQAVASQVNSWRPSADSSWQEPTDSPDYFIEILNIAGRIRISDTYSRLLVLAKTGELKKKVAFGIDLHYQLLRVLFGFGMDTNRNDLELLIERDIEDPRYSALCYRRSWELEFRKGIENLPILLKCYQNDHSVDAAGALNRFIRKLGQKGFKMEFFHMLRKLEEPYYTILCDIMESIGIELCPNSCGRLDNFLILWKEGDRIVKIVIEIPKKVNQNLREAIQAIYLWMAKRYEYLGWNEMIPPPVLAPEVRS
jgi:hypothetical protein